MRKCRVCENCKYRNPNFNICERELMVEGKFKCAFSYTKACRHFKQKEEV